jgi:C4-dicarboxylate transporter, DctM subunit
MSLDRVRHAYEIMLDAIVVIGQQTPPVASVLMTCCAIAKADLWEVTKFNVYFVAVLLAVLILVTYVPVTGLGLVDLFYH